MKPKIWVIKGLLPVPEYQWPQVAMLRESGNAGHTLQDPSFWTSEFCYFVGFCTPCTAWEFDISTMSGEPSGWRGAELRRLRHRTGGRQITALALVPGFEVLCLGSWKLSFSSQVMFLHRDWTELEKRKRGTLWAWSGKTLGRPERRLGL